MAIRLSKVQEEILSSVDNMVQEPMYEDLTPYLAGVRDTLNAVFHLDYADIAEYLEYVEDEVKSLNIKTPVTVKSYGKEQTFENKNKAIATVKNWCECSEGAEQQRYNTILCQLLSGNTYCSDEV